MLWLEGKLRVGASAFQTLLFGIYYLFLSIHRSPIMSRPVVNMMIPDFSIFFFQISLNVPFTTIKQPSLSLDSLTSPNTGHQSMGCVAFRGTCPTKSSICLSSFARELMRVRQVFGSDWSHTPQPSSCWMVTLRTPLNT